MYKCLISLLLCWGTVAHAQLSPLPVIRARSRSVDIRDGANFYKGRWNISPELRPDVYLVDKGRARQVTFYTDIDSISFSVAPGKSYDFVILLNGKDSAYTRVTTINPVKLSYQKQHAAGSPVMIPFTFGRGDKIHIRGSINGSALLDLMFDTGSDQVVISKSGRKKGVKLDFDGSSQSVALGGASTVQRSSANIIEISGLRWEGVSVVYIEDADADGIIGYNVFADKIVQIDFDRKVLLIHDALPPVPQGYTKLALQFRNNLPFIKARMTNKGVAYEDLFEYDSGGSESVFINNESAKAHRLYGSMKALEDNRKSRGMDGHPVYSQLVLLPELRIGGHVLTNVPVDLEKPSDLPVLGWSIFGMDVIKRFNVMLDYKDYNIYLKPNSLVTVAYHRSVSPMLLVGAAVVVLMLIAGVFIYIRRKRNAGMIQSRS